MRKDKGINNMVLQAMEDKTGDSVRAIFSDINWSGMSTQGLLSMVKNVTRMARASKKSPYYPIRVIATKILADNVFIITERIKDSIVNSIIL